MPEHPFEFSHAEPLNPRPARSVMHLNSRLPVAVFLTLLAFQLFNPSRVWMAILLVLGLMLVTAYLWAMQLHNWVTAHRRVQGTWVLVGDVLRETFVVENRGWLPALWVEIVDHSELPGYHPDWVATVGGEGHQEYTTETRCERRGVFTLGPWELRTGDPLGLFSVTREFFDTRSILVYPRPMHLPNLNLPRGAASGPARTSRRTPQFTTSAATVRPYVPGDEMRRVHWPSSAHHDALMVREFDLEPSGDLWIVLDLDAGVQAGEGLVSTLEYAVTLAASVATQMLAENRRVGLVAFGREASQVMPQAGQMQTWRILETLAHAETAPNRPLVEVLRTVRDTVGRGRTVLTITPSPDPAWIAELLHLARAGNAPAAVLLDASSFRGGAPANAADRGGSLTPIHSLLAEHGIPTHLIDRSFEFRPVHRITRTRRELRTLAATGRVIAVEVEEVV